MLLYFIREFGFRAEDVYSKKDWMNANQEIIIEKFQNLKVEPKSQPEILIEQMNTLKISKPKKKKRYSPYRPVRTSNPYSENDWAIAGQEL
ncbi:hypothetical protein HDV01_001490 [Terramyces sp. JEL0728]|nr:hypothetical protein HDV01_001490 [Terramyces sp. JEL0728]